jgi:hypothetical protein
MTLPEESSDTATLELQSLQLDIKTLQRHREQDRKEFVDFSNQVQSNFLAIQNNFVTMQSNMDKILSTFIHNQQAEGTNQTLAENTQTVKIGTISHLIIDRNYLQLHPAKRVSMCYCTNQCHLLLENNK